LDHCDIDSLKVGLTFLTTV